jgi:hypothetical protein
VKRPISLAKPCKRASFGNESFPVTGCTPFDTVSLPLPCSRSQLPVLSHGVSSNGSQCGAAAVYAEGKGYEIARDLIGMRLSCCHYVPCVTTALPMAVVPCCHITHALCIWGNCDVQIMVLKSCVTHYFRASKDSETDGSQLSREIPYG